jgi:2-oxoisovalerate dehydrogenase E1 component alpha subunit
MVRTDRNSVSFPGAVKSKFTNKLSFEQPADYPAIPTYRVMDSEGVICDETYKPDMSVEETVQMYRVRVASFCLRRLN